MRTQGTAEIVDGIARLLNLIDCPPESGYVLFDVLHMIAREDNNRADGLIDRANPYDVDHTAEYRGEPIAWSELAGSVDALTDPRCAEGMTFGLVAVPQMEGEPDADPIDAAENRLLRMLSAERVMSQLRANAARALLEIDPDNETQFPAEHVHLYARDLTGD